jgi:hypothetical protein
MLPPSDATTRACALKDSAPALDGSVNLDRCRRITHTMLQIDDVTEILKQKRPSKSKRI